ncbi:uncharacterized protein MYCFIDRAFT_208786 [Pseudocercospora fijiensis CIRAD86]|uniref:Uncharacterized protein n=1 Tax=Pseudocercospora fijiensis (strain CIRAD86) TaxID=383855 RepID=M3A492_PSEFD|nr:uncharacterized protein MYCFIDRAFT_208786 [Pseudocercospora fijiensis CIRAD86]EME79431.1 hypothetical protein MYCFIDRAFT_208786 [Pseudocercospora fijiensis CIRAD86]
MSRDLWQVGTVEAQVLTQPIDWRSSDAHSTRDFCTARLAWLMTEPSRPKQPCRDRDKLSRADCPMADMAMFEAYPSRKLLDPNGLQRITSSDREGFGKYHDQYRHLCKL